MTGYTLVVAPLTGLLLHYSIATHWQAGQGAAADSRLSASESHLHVSSSSTALSANLYALAWNGGATTYLVKLTPGSAQVGPSSTAHS